MKTDQEKIKEYDELQSWFTERSNYKFMKIDETGSLHEKVQQLMKWYGDASETTGRMKCLPYIKHAKPFIEFVKKKYPQLTGPANNHGISYEQEMKAIFEYFKEISVETPKDGAFLEWFAFLLRSENLMKCEEISMQWSWEVLVDKGCNAPDINQ